MTFIKCIEGVATRHNSKKLALYKNYVLCTSVNREKAYVKKEVKTQNTCDPTSKAR